MTAVIVRNLAGIGGSEITISETQVEVLAVHRGTDAGLIGKRPGAGIGIEIVPALTPSIDNHAPPTPPRTKGLIQYAKSMS